MPIGFVDTNVLLYAASGREVDYAKTAKARALLRRPSLAISAQVINEFAANALNPRKLGLTREETRLWCGQWAALPVLPISADLPLAALEIGERFQISYWDALIVAAASRLGCAILYSEDLSDGQQYGTVRVLNPFL